ncbi:hypothetical protein ACFO6R_02725 [Eubacterium multiforme]|uniref:Transposase n=1 Tax=Eubacterium multiforme TaxID=83339 RepID=A0ABT9UNW9_9FIRM|nr:hypothetical protein [Eubacterium multiforme]MDQ0148330.1 hypothetical protein [Eubacterium multiforme]
MKNKYSLNLKNCIKNEYKDGKMITEISNEYNIPTSTINNWVKKIELEEVINIKKENEILKNLLLVILLKN